MVICFEQQIPSQMIWWARAISMKLVWRSCVHLVLRKSRLLGSYFSGGVVTMQRTTVRVQQAFQNTHNILPVALHELHPKARRAQGVQYNQHNLTDAVVLRTGTWHASGESGRRVALLFLSTQATRQPSSSMCWRTLSLLPFCVTRCTTARSRLSHAASV